MLVLTRGRNEELVIDLTNMNPEASKIITITNVNTHGNKVRLGIAADKSIRVDRAEIAEIRRNEAAKVLESNEHKAVGHGSGGVLQELPCGQST